MPRRAEPTPRLLHVVTPRANAAGIAAAENMLAALAGAEPFSLEIAADHTVRWFLARAPGAAMADRLAEQLAVAYPQADVDPLDAECDPARPAPGEVSRSCALVLRRPEYLPLRAFDDADLAGEGSAQADPVLGLLGALGSVGPGWRTLSQLVLAPAPEHWSRRYAHLARERPPERESTGRGWFADLTPVFLVLALLALAAAAPTLLRWYWRRDWLHLGGVGLALALGVVALVWAANHLFGREPEDPRLVREKITPIAYRAQLRLTVFAPAGTPPAAIEARLRGLAGAYRQYSLATGNGLVARPLRARPGELARPARLGHRAATLNVRELAGLWHLPRGEAAVPRLERTGSRRLPPQPWVVAGGCRIGAERHHGREDVIRLDDGLLARNLLLLAKTGKGKSTLLLRMAHHRMAAGRALVLVDPHRDLAEALLGRVPDGREDDVVYLDVGASARPFGLNLLDVGFGWSRLKAVSNALMVFQREFDRFWGPRMEDAFRHALLTLYEANERLCGSPGGRERQYTILDVPAVLTDGGFRQTLLGMRLDPAVEHWWTGYFHRLDPRLQLEIVNPVLTKIHRYAGSPAARVVVGQPCSTVDPGGWLRDGKVVVVNTNKGVVGEDTAALVGATLLNLVALVVGEQARLARGTRPPVTLLVDEFHTMPGADYEGILSELGKYGANLVLATQSLGRLDALDREHQRGLKASLFANLDGIFAFNCSAEDARYLVHELGWEDVSEDDLVSLAEHRCYARLTFQGQRPPVYSVELDAPAPDDPDKRRRLVEASAGRFGREGAAVEKLLEEALNRVRGRSRADADEGDEGGDGAAAAARPPDGSPPASDAAPPPTRRQRSRGPRRSKPDRPNPRLPGLDGEAAA